MLLRRVLKSRSVFAQIKSTEIFLEMIFLGGMGIKHGIQLKMLSLNHFLLNKTFIKRAPQANVAMSLINDKKNFCNSGRLVYTEFLSKGKTDYFHCISRVLLNNHLFNLSKLFVDEYYPR